MEGCPSGLRSTLGKRVERNLTQVRILSPPPILRLRLLVKIRTFFDENPDCEF